MGLWEILHLRAQPRLRRIQEPQHLAPLETRGTRQIERRSTHLLRIPAGGLDALHVRHPATRTGSSAAYTPGMPGRDIASNEPSAAEIAQAEQAILSTLATYQDGRPPTPRALQQAAAEGRPPELTSIAFWQLVESGHLVFDLSGRVKLNDIPPRP
jgi:hypothetical protein